MILIEYCGAGDSAFGRQGDGRVQGQDGIMLQRQHADTNVSHVYTVEAAHAAAKSISHRSSNSIFGVAPDWR